MKKVWKKNSFAIILILVSCLTAASVSYFGNSASEEAYIKITVKEGDSLWALADELAKNSQMDRESILNWLKKNNDIHGETIIAGEELLVPLKKIAEDGSGQYASAGGSKSIE